MKPKIGINKKTTVFLIVGMAGIFAMLLAPTLNAVPANAINDKWNCYNQQSGKTVGGSGPVPETPCNQGLCRIKIQVVKYLQVNNNQNDKILYSFFILL